jgi:hypothetical protein
MRYEVNGNVMQTVAIDLAPGETVYSQTNAMAWMNDQVTMDTHTGGGFLAGLARSFGGGSFFITDFTARGLGHVFPERSFRRSCKQASRSSVARRRFSSPRNRSRSKSPGSGASGQGSLAAAGSSCRR